MKAKLTFLPCLWNVILFVAVFIQISPRTAMAEGSSEIGSSQTLVSSTILKLDINDSANESISWFGSGSINIYKPDGGLLGTYASGATINPPVSGVFEIVLLSDQASGWDITVEKSGTAQKGRLWSRKWDFYTGSYTESDAINGSFYSLVNGGDKGKNAVVEIYFSGLAGYSSEVAANETGIQDNTTNSTPISGNTYSAEMPVYLNPPASALNNAVDPTIVNLSAKKVTSSGYQFSFDTDADGVCHIILDANKDSLFDLSDPDDVKVSGPCKAGSNTLSWDGKDMYGVAVADGEYEVVARIHVGEVHFVANDIETIYEGIRFYEVDGSLHRLPLIMFWNDALVQGNAIPMPNGHFGLESSGILGLDSDSYLIAHDANVNARAWGAFTATGKGHDAYLNTYTWLRDDQSAVSAVTIAPGDPSSGIPCFPVRTAKGVIGSVCL